MAITVVAAVVGVGGAPCAELVHLPCLTNWLLVRRSTNLTWGTSLPIGSMVLDGAGIYANIKGVY